jgi:hypothetical protein
VFHSAGSRIPNEQLAAAFELIHLLFKEHMAGGFVYLQ